MNRLSIVIINIKSLLNQKYIQNYDQQYYRCIYRKKVLNSSPKVIVRIYIVDFIGFIRILNRNYRETRLITQMMLQTFMLELIGIRRSNNKNIPYGTIF